MERRLTAILAADMAGSSGPTKRAPLRDRKPTVAR